MRYRSLADHLQLQIQQGRLAPGARLPSLRTLARQYQVSVNTALNCYQWLESAGWIQARARAGFYVLGLPAHVKSWAGTALAQPSQPYFRARITEGTGPVALAGVSFGPLGISPLAPELLPTQALQRALKRATRRLGERLHNYPEPQGEAILRQALARHLTHYQLSPLPEELFITNGCLDAVRQCLQLTTAPGDVVAISSPCFNGLLSMLASLGRKVLELPGTAEGIDLDQLEAHLQTRRVAACLLSTSHLNPQGTSLSTRHKVRLARMAATYQVPIIEDDIYLELDTRRVGEIPAKCHDAQGWILWCGSVSKSLGAGLRVGWCWPGRFADRWREQLTAQHYGTNLLAQWALADLINTGDYQRHLAQLKPRLSAQLRQYRQHIASALPTAAISNPLGGCVLWVEQPRLDADALASAAHARDIDLRHGSLFSSRHLYRNCFRINAGWPLLANGVTTAAAGQLDSVLALAASQLNLAQALA